MSTVAAYGIGLATRTAATGKVLDTWYPIVGSGDDLDRAHPLLDAVGPLEGATTVEISVDILSRVEVAADDPVLQAITSATDIGQPVAPTGTERVAVVTAITDLAAAPVDAHDVYLRLHLLSHRLVQPHGANLDGAFGLLNNVVWTDLGPCDPDGFETLRLRLAAAGHRVLVTSVDKFPRMTDYVVPSGVRIGDTDRVRLGAHLAAGTTVMHEGFVNFNAGTLGASMVEGRISAGVVVGDGTDLGGGASIMGTLSGGGKEVVSIGRGSLVGANAGLGIALGDDCVVEAGLYLTAGTKVTLPDGTIAKARDLSGQDAWLFRRDSQTGAVVALRREGAAGDWGGLNVDLHTND